MDNTSFGIDIVSTFEHTTVYIHYAVYVKLSQS